MEKKLMLIINPAAGRGGYKTNIGEALHSFDLGGYRTTLFFGTANSARDRPSLRCRRLWG